MPQTEAVFDGFAQIQYVHQLAVKKDLGLFHFGNFRLRFVKLCLYNVFHFLFVFKGIDDVESEATADELKELDSQIRIQNEEYFKIFDYIANIVPYVHRIGILTANDQMVPATSHQVSVNIMIIYVAN